MKKIPSYQPPHVLTVDPFILLQTGLLCDKLGHLIEIQVRDESWTSVKATTGVTEMVKSRES